MDETIQLNVQQENALRLICNEHASVFVTGSAGTGKSVLLRKVVATLPNVAVIAPTGIAAINVGGRTMHSFFGLGIAAKTVQQLVSISSSKRPLKSALQKIQTIVIDEISMVTPKLFVVADLICRACRGKHTLPFGGIQIVCFGDFAQLPPVITTADAEDNLQDNLLQQWLLTPPDAKFVFDTRSWTETIGSRGIMLTQSMRQTTTDPRFFEALESIRRGHLTPEANQLLSSRVIPLPWSDGIEPTHLVPLRAQAASINESRLAELPGDEFYLNAKIAVHGSGWRAKNARNDISASDTLERYSRFPFRLNLKVGAQVMLLVNKADCGLSNGSRGVVTSIIPSSTLPDVISLVIVQFESTTIAIDVDRDEVDLGRSSEASSSHRDTIVVDQIPLQLAWAATIHKAQGLTLDRASISLSDAFAPGQAYVALSRVRNLESLVLLETIPEHVVFCDDRVSSFYNF